MTPGIDLITRREALRRTALLIGGTLAASTILAGERVAWAAMPRRAPRTLSAQQLELVATIAEHIVPATDTPGARAAGVHHLVDLLLTDHYGLAERQRFLAGLRATNIRAIRSHGAPFLRCHPNDQLALLTALDAEAYPPVTRAPREPVKEMQQVADSLVRPGSTASVSIQPPAAAVDGVLDERSATRGAGWFFRRMKELTLLGYYTSELGATRELRVNPMGYYRGDMPYAAVGRSWA